VVVYAIGRSLAGLRQRAAAIEAQQTAFASTSATATGWRRKARSGV
jgi:hypothetical protein